MATITDVQIQEVEAQLGARPFQLFIDGAWSPAASGRTFEVYNPATSAVLARAAQGDASDIDRAVRAARAAFESGPWADMSFDARAMLMNRLADAIADHIDEIAVIESLDGGNPLGHVQHIDLQMAVRNLRANAGWVGKVAGDTTVAPVDARSVHYTLRQPVGVAGVITPWNAPFLMVLNKAGAAFAAGCTVVSKPAELAPLSALRLAQLIEEVGFPAGVFNLVTGLGSEAGQALVDHPDVNKISFTGSTRVGRSILAGAAGNMKRVTLELGGKSPVIVFPDADLDAAAAAIVQEVCFKTGQYCAAGTRLFVHDSVHDALVEKMAKAMQGVQAGAGTVSGTTMGPIISQKQLDRVLHYIDEGQKQGARVVTGGHRMGGQGWFVEPTLLTDVTPEMSVHQDEIFGPVLSVLRFHDATDYAGLAAQANDSTYGLAAKVWTGNLAAAHAMARRIDAGLITINGGAKLDAPRPFGGFKQSGIGREGGLEGILAYTETKTVSISY